ncbi:MAG: hypothetical protein ACHREM_07390 [Polyangiales bacterium]
MRVGALALYLVAIAGGTSCTSSGSTSGAPSVSVRVSDAGVDTDGATQGSIDDATAAEDGGDGSLTYDVDALGVPTFVTTDFLDVTQLARISRFRSGAGHDYSDGIERCRSMKHYYEPNAALDWTKIPVRAPVSGTVDRMDPEATYGMQPQIRSDAQPAFHIIVFHVDPVVQVGDHVNAGQVLGTHASQDTDFDIAVSVDAPTGQILVSYFDVMTAPLFETYLPLGITDRSQVVIDAAERDLAPLTCSADGNFTGGGVLPDGGWIPDWVAFGADGGP